MEHPLHIQFFFENCAQNAGIMFDAFGYLLCIKLCWHNWLGPTVQLESITVGILSIKSKRDPLSENRPFSQNSIYFIIKMY